VKRLSVAWSYRSEFLDLELHPLLGEALGEESGSFDLSIEGTDGHMGGFSEFVRLSPKKAAELSAALLSARHRLSVHPEPFMRVSEVYEIPRIGSLVGVDSLSSAVYSYDDPDHQHRIRKDLLVIDRASFRVWSLLQIERHPTCSGGVGLRAGLMLGGPHPLPEAGTQLEVIGGTP
jgi:hypothetical protein